MAITIICDEYFVQSLNRVCEGYEEYFSIFIIFN